MRWPRRLRYLTTFTIRPAERLGLCLSPLLLLAGDPGASVSSSAPSARHGAPRAIILAPMQRTFGEDLGAIRAQLERGGYAVKVYADSAASLHRFRGDSLSRYRLVYISTHGTARHAFYGDTSASTVVHTGALVTGTPFRDELSRRHADIPAGMVGLQGVEGERLEFAAIGLPYWRHTGADFRRTTLVFSACATAQRAPGVMSLVDGAIALGAPAATGWADDVRTPFATALLRDLLDEQFLRGRSPAAATAVVVARSLSPLYPHRWFWSTAVRGADTRLLVTRTATPGVR